MNPTYATSNVGFRSKGLTYNLSLFWGEKTRLSVLAIGYGKIELVPLCYNLSMKRDSIFYKLFQQSPTLLFDLLETPPANVEGYRFDSVAVKEPKFEIDGVFLPPESEPPGIC